MLMLMMMLMSMTTIHIEMFTRFTNKMFQTILKFAHHAYQIMLIQPNELGFFFVFFWHNIVFSIEYLSFLYSKV